MNDPAGDPNQIWERGWEGHRDAQRRRVASLPLALKLAWLEEAHQLVLQLARSRGSGVPGRRDSTP